MSIPEDDEHETGQVPDHRSRSVPFRTVLALLIIGVAFLGAFLFQSGVFNDKGKEGLGKEQIDEITRAITARLPNEHWIVSSVQQKGGDRVEAEVIIDDAFNIKPISSVPRIMRVIFYEQICPTNQSGILEILGGRWTLWITLSGAGKKLTGGSCKY